MEWEKGADPATMNEYRTVNKDVCDALNKHNVHVCTQCTTSFRRINFLFLYSVFTPQHRELNTDDIEARYFHFHERSFRGLFCVNIFHEEKYKKKNVNRAFCWRF